MSKIKTYEPDRWVVVEATIDEVIERRIVAGWSGGYLDTEHWRISSMIVNFSDNDDHYLFDNESGSRYICYKNRFGFTGLSAVSFFSFNEKQTVNWEITKSYINDNVTQELYDAQRDFVGE